MILEHDRSRLAWVAAEACDRVVERDLHVILNRDPVLKHADLGGFDLLALLEDGGSEVNIITLPDCRRLTRVDLGCRYLVDSTTVIVLALQPVAIQDLDLV